jgi:endonuclease G, mitochondrial
LKSILSDQELNEALLKIVRTRESPLKSIVRPADVVKLLESPGTYPIDRAAFGPHDPETIVWVFNRPILLVQGNTFTSGSVENTVLRERLEQARKRIETAIPAVGRIELENSPYEWVGTGWLVDENVVVTNRHVATVFGLGKDDQFTFRMGSGGRPIRARIDYLEERGIVVPQIEFQITRILHIEEDLEGRPDIAFLQVARRSSENEALPRPIELTERTPETGDSVVVLGYPAKDSRIPEPEYMEQYFGGIYDVKRLAPGLLMNSADPTQICHDCTTLGGNSGSVVLDTRSGKAVGLHFGGTYRVANYAVSATVIKQRLDDVKKRTN